jgi:hypothetical protein
VVGVEEEAPQFWRAARRLTVGRKRILYSIPRRDLDQHLSAQVGLEVKPERAGSMNTRGSAVSAT